MSELRRARGFTLIEVIIFIVVVSAGVAGVLAVFNTSVASSADPMVTKQSLAIAESLMEEILLKEYDKPGGSTVVGYPGGQRIYFDCVDDYNGYTTTAGAVDGQGNAVTGLDKYNITPAVVVAATTISGVTVKRVTVSVTGPGNGGTVTVIGYRGNY